MTANSTVKYGLLLAAWLWAPAGSAAPSSNLYTWISTYTSGLESRDDTNVSITPTEKHGALINSTDPMSGHYGEDASSRTPYTIVSLSCMLLLASMLGSRAQQLKLRHLRQMNFIRLLVVMLYLLCLAFVFSAAIVESGLGLSNLSICYSAIIVCLVFYVGSKVVMYMFLVERAHALRAPYLRRTRDWIWLFGMIIVVTGFGSIAIIAFIFPLAEMSPEDGKCRIGLPLKVTIPLLTFDIVINVALTSIFVHHLGPLIRFESNVGGISGNPYMPSHIGGSLKRLFRKSKPRISVSSTLDGDWTTNLNHENMRAVEKLVWKSLIGAVVVMIPTVINLTLLYHWQGREQGWLCFTICTLDATWQVCVVHWLTVDPIEMDSRSMMIGIRDPRVAGDSASTSTVGTAIPLRR